LLSDPESTRPSDEERSDDYGHAWFATSHSEAALRRFEEALAKFRGLVSGRH